MPKISVIIPIYGIEKYIRRCAESLFMQSLDDIEFVFVNDCTADNSIKILKECIAEHPEINNRIKLIEHDVNKGLPQARKTGFLCSSGEYIAHCDSDDWVESNIYQLMYEAAKSDKADMVICDYFVNDGKNKKNIFIPETNGLLVGPVWNKIVKRDVYEKGIIFPTANKAEDGAIMAQLSYFSKKRTYLHLPLYNYFSNPQSMCGLKDEHACIKKLNEESQNVELRIKFLKKMGTFPKYEEDVVAWKFEARNNLIPCISKKHIYRLWRSTYPEIDKKILLSGNIRMKIKYLLLRLKLQNLIKLFR